MVEAALWGLVGASSLLLGAVIAFTFRIPDRILGLVMGFGAGVLISAVAYELVEEAVRVSVNGVWVGLGFASGALTFFVGDLLIDRSLGAGGWGILLGTVLDGLPESAVIGISLLSGDGVSVAVLVAVFLSNVPEAISATADLRSGGARRGRILVLWTAVAIASALAAGLGYSLLGDAPGDTIAWIDAFAAGAILTMLADEMIPEGYERAGHRKLVGVVTAFGFAVAAALSFQT
ncbi:MAG TPA: ZIP family zinc transporter [Actinomycetota bacterium]|nr:ZIP family zinc transporter [Actinomycetota bacterium]